MTENPHPRARQLKDFQYSEDDDDVYFEKIKSLNYKEALDEKYKSQYKMAYVRRLALLISAGAIVTAASTLYVTYNQSSKVSYELETLLRNTQLQLTDATKEIQSLRKKNADLENALRSSRQGYLDRIGPFKKPNKKDVPDEPPNSSAMQPDLTK